MGTEPLVKEEVSADVKTIVVIRTATGEVTDAALSFEAADRAALALADIFNTPFHCRYATEAEIEYLRQSSAAARNTPAS